MDAEFIAIGDTVADSPDGPGVVTGITEAGYPQVNHVAVVWLKRTDGVVFDPFNKRPQDHTNPSHSQDTP